MMLWEMYWQLVDAYGFDPEIRDTNAGNFIALRLVVEGMRLQPCNPGFVDGRDAILLADTLLYDAAHSCLIWKAFAKRGLGYGASQGNPDEIGDEGERESFLPPPVCQNRLLLQKHVTPEVVAGKDVTVQLTLSNNRPSTAIMYKALPACPPLPSMEECCDGISILWCPCKVWSSTTVLPLTPTANPKYTGMNASKMTWISSKIRGRMFPSTVMTIGM